MTTKKALLSVPHAPLVRVKPLTSSSSPTTTPPSVLSLPTSRPPASTRATLSLSSLLTKAITSSPPHPLLPTAMSQRSYRPQSSPLGFTVTLQEVSKKWISTSAQSHPPLATPLPSSIIPT